MTSTVSPASDRSTGFYAPALDGLRALAVAGVLLSHFSPTLGSAYFFGTVGVRLFMVLSGLLITTILLQARARVAAGAGFGREYGSFLLRRGWRLWPAFYACLFVALVFQLDTDRPSPWWHALFLSNFEIAASGYWPGLLSHLWSLAAEQQFYLLWPFVVLHPPRRLALGLGAGLLLLGPVSRAALPWLGWGSALAPQVALPCVADFFVAGALVAWWRQAHPAAAAPSRALRLGALAAAGTWFALSASVGGATRLSPLFFALDASMQTACFACLVGALTRGPTPAGWRWLECPPLRYLGRISYGIYLYHNLMHYFAPGLLRRIAGSRYFESEWAHVGWLTLWSVVAAVVSYHWFEAPLRRWGRRLEGRKIPSLP